MPVTIRGGTTPFFAVTDPLTQLQYHLRIYTVRRRGAKRVEMSPNSPNLPTKIFTIPNYRAGFDQFHIAAQALIDLSYTDAATKRVRFDKARAEWSRRMQHISTIAAHFAPMFSHGGPKTTAHRVQRAKELQQRTGVGGFPSGYAQARVNRRGEMLRMEHMASAALDPLLELTSPQRRLTGYNGREQQALHSILLQMRAALNAFRDEVIGESQNRADPT